MHKSLRWVNTGGEEAAYCLPASCQLFSELQYAVDRFSEGRYRLPLEYMRRTPLCYADQEKGGVLYSRRELPELPNCQLKHEIRSSLYFWQIKYFFCIYNNCKVTKHGRMCMYCKSVLHLVFLLPDIHFKGAFQPVPLHCSALLCVTAQAIMCGISFLNTHCGRAAHSFKMSC